MSEPIILYITHHITGELLGTHEAVNDIKQPDRVVVPPYQTPSTVPSTVLEDNEYWAYLDINGKPVRDHELGNWQKKTRNIKATAYLKSDCTKTKEFDDKSLVTDDYTIEQPLTRFDEWKTKKWVTNLSNKHIYDYNQVDETRRQLYSRMCDPLRFEAEVKAEEGKTEEAAEMRVQACEARKEIQAKNPWPVPPSV